MANRATYDGPRSMYAKMVGIFARVTFGATGAPTLDVANSRGVLSVTRNSAGLFTFVFGSKINGRNALDPYVALAEVDVTFNTAGVSGGPKPPAASQPAVYANNVGSGSQASIQLALLGATSSSVTTLIPTDPAQGEIGHFRFTFIDTKAG